MGEEEPKTIGDNRQPDGRFGPGNIGNPEGRPKGSVSLTTKIKQALEKNPADLETIVKFVIEASKTDPAMLKTLWSYLDGQPKQEIDLGINYDDSMKELRGVILMASGNYGTAQLKPPVQGESKDIASDQGPAGDIPSDSDTAEKESGGDNSDSVRQEPDGGDSGTAPRN